MVEDVEELCVESQLYPLAQGKPLGDVKVAPEEVGAAQSIAVEVAELAGLRRVASIAGAGGGINGRNECVRIEPLYSA